MDTDCGLLRTATTGTDHLYYAEEEIWLADVTRLRQDYGGQATNGGYRVTQRFFDALGRETNTVVGVGFTPGCACSATSTLHSALCTLHTVYPYGGSDYSVATDERGKATIRRVCELEDCTETIETVLTNDVTVLTTKSRAYHGGGTSTRREWTGGTRSCASEERRFDDYAADGRRIAYVVTESSDCGVVTNSVTTYDLIGRVVSVETPLGVTSNIYDGTTSRLLSAVYTAGFVHRETLHLYNDLGEQIGTVLDGVTNRTDVAYELFSNVWWKVTREATVGPSTNALTMVREQLTGLGADCFRAS